MPDEMLAGQVAPVVTDEAATAEAAQPNAATTTSQTDGEDHGEIDKSGSPKTFTQKELDEIVSRRVAKAEAKTERRVLRTLERFIPQQQQAPQNAQQVQQRADDAGLARHEGESETDFIRRIVKAERESWEREQEQAKERERIETLGKKTNDIYAQAEKLGDDFDRDAFDEHITRPIAEALVESDDAARLMHYLGSNAEEMERIARLSPARQAAELGKLEARLEADAKAASEKKPPQRSNAPQALSSAKGTAASGAPDPKDSAAWIRYQNARDSARMRGK